MRASAFRAATLGAGLLALAALGACDEKALVAVDDTPPDAAIDAPADGSTVSGVAFTVDVTASDAESGVDRVEVTVDGREPVAATAPPFHVQIVTLGVDAGTPLTVVAETFDVAGNSTVRSVLVDVAARTLTRLTTDPNDDLHPAWSPDGSRIAFQANRDGFQFDLWTMNADGTGQTRLTADVNEDRHPAWSPDGAWIAFDSDRQGTFDVWRLPVATGESGAENLTFGNDDDVEPAWSPDGTLWFASSRGDETDFDIWRQDVATGVATQVTAFAENDRAPALSADGSYLAFTSRLNFGTPHVYTMPVGAVEVQPLTGDLGVTESDPAWSRTGAVILYTRKGATHGNLWFATRDVEEPARQGTFGTGTIGDGGAAWHPDGDRIAFHSDRSGNPDIWLIE